jgi:hypothetical protein
MRVGMIVKWRLRVVTAEGHGDAVLQLFFKESHLLVALLAIKFGKSELVLETNYLFLQVEGGSALDHIIP